MLVRPVSVGSRGPDAKHDPRPLMVPEALADGREKVVTHPQIRLGRRQRHLLCGHERAQPIDRMVVSMALVDAGVGDEQSLCAEPKTDALRYAGQHGGTGGTRGAVENP